MFDKNGDNHITKKEMQDAFEYLEMNVKEETINYVFKMADLSGEGAITFDEWRSLFESVIKDDMKDK